MLKSWMWICCFPCGGAGMNKFFILQQNSESFQMIWFVISLRFHGALMSDGVGRVSSGDALNQTKGSWCHVKEKHAPTAAVAWPRAPVNTAGGRHVCVGSRSEEMKSNEEHPNRTSASPLREAGVSSRPACRGLAHSYGGKWPPKIWPQPTSCTYTRCCQTVVRRLSSMPLQLR